MNHSAEAKRRLLALVMLLTLLWGTNWVLFPIAVRELTILTFRAVCLLGAGALVLVAAYLQGVSLAVPKGERRTLVIAALAYLVIWNLASAYAAVWLPSGQAAILGFTMPVWATLLAWAFMREVPSKRLLGSVMLAGCGVSLLALSSRSSLGVAPLGIAAGLAAGIGWAAGTLILKRASLTVQPIVATGWQLVIAGTPLAIGALAFGSHELFMPTQVTLAVIAYITIVPMAIGNVIWFSIAKDLPASVSGLSTVMVPIVAMLTGAVVKQEPLGVMEISAMACCTGAMALALFS